MSPWNGDRNEASLRILVSHPQIANPQRVMPAGLMPFPRYVIRIDLRLNRLDLPLPLGQHFREFLLRRRLHPCEVDRLPEILFKVVQLLMPIFEEPEQLPVAFADRGDGRAALVAVGRRVPERYYSRQ
jgi:hypothetical protein